MRYLKGYQERKKRNSLVWKLGVGLANGRNPRKQKGRTPITKKNPQKSMTKKYLAKQVLRKSVKCRNTQFHEVEERFQYVKISHYRLRFVYNKKICVTNYIYYNKLQLHKAKIFVEKFYNPTS